ncbi:MAG: hypothetical protein LC808_43770 [Actinobacteria bacterium]|nr:hypothetical protein [Actinomycetota bacterium]
MSNAASLPEPITTRALALVAAGADHVPAVEELVRLSEGRRELLEEARAELVARLHADTADYDATKALQLVNAALSQVSRGTGTGT